MNLAEAHVVDLPVVHKVKVERVWKGLTDGRDHRVRGLIIDIGPHEWVWNEESRASVFFFRNDEVGASRNQGSDIRATASGLLKERRHVEDVFLCKAQLGHELCFLAVEDVLDLLIQCAEGIVLHNLTNVVDGVAIVATGAVAVSLVVGSISSKTAQAEWVSAMTKRNPLGALGSGMVVVYSSTWPAWSQVESTKRLLDSHAV